MSIEYLIGGGFFSGISIYILIVGNKRIAQKNLIFAERWANWEKRNLWPNIVVGIFLAVVGIIFFIKGIIQLTRQELQGISDLICGMIAIYIAKFPLLRPRDAALMSADSQRRHAEFHVRHSWIFLIIAILTGSIGVTLLAIGVIELLK